jgi:lipopolysaccharide biosynthesis regulator YciM
MNTFFIEFRDPLFGIIVFFLLLFIISFISYWLGRRKTIEDTNDLESFLGKFDETSTASIGSQVRDNSITNETWLQLAIGYEHQGHFEKSIEIYLALLAKKSDSLAQKEILLKLGHNYFKAGFLERSRQSFLQILNNHPRTPVALHHLILIYEYLQQFDKALVVMDSLEELQGGQTTEKLYLQTRAMLCHPKATIDEKADYLIKLYAQHSQLGYLVFDYLFTHRPSLAWSHFDQSLCSRIADILWRVPVEHLNMEIISSNAFLQELFSARGDLNLVRTSATFEFETLMALRRANYTKATLQFEYVCTTCHTPSIFPFYRCSTCHAIDTIDNTMSLTKERFEDGNTFL